MKYIKIDYLDFPTIRTNYTFLLELNDDNNFTGKGVTEIDKKYGPKEHEVLSEWTNNNKVKFNDDEIKKYEISEDEFRATLREATKDQRKN